MDFVTVFTKRMTTTLERKWSLQGVWEEADSPQAHSEVVNSFRKYMTTGNTLYMAFVDYDKAVN